MLDLPKPTQIVVILLKDDMKWYLQAKTFLEPVVRRLGMDLVPAIVDKQWGSIEIKLEETGLIVPFLSTSAFDSRLISIIETGREALYAFIDEVRGRNIPIQPIFISGDRELVSGIAKLFDFPELENILNRIPLIGMDAAAQEAVWVDLSQKITAQFSNNAIQNTVIEYGKGTIFARHGDFSSCIAIDKNKKRVYTSADDGFIKVWNLNTGALIESISWDNSLVADLLFVNSQNLLISLCRNHDTNRTSIFLADTNASGHYVSLDEVSFTKYDPTLQSMAITPDETTLFAVTGDGLFAWNLKSKERIPTDDNQSMTGELLCLVMHPGGKYFFAGSANGVISIWRLKDRKCVRSISAHGDCIEKLAISPDGSRIISAGRDKQLKIWSIKQLLDVIELEDDGNSRLLLQLEQSGENVKYILGLVSAVYNIAITPDSRFAVTTSSEKFLQVWDLDKLEEVARLYGHKDAIQDVVLIPGTTEILSAAMDGAIIRWDLKDIVDTSISVDTLSGHYRGLLNHDAAALVDELGFQESVVALAEVIRRKETLPPLAIGLYGPWGAGKSTYLALVKQYLEKAEKAQGNLFLRFQTALSARKQTLLDTDKWFGTVPELLLWLKAIDACLLDEISAIWLRFRRWLLQKLISCLSTLSFLLNLWNYPNNKQRWLSREVEAFQKKENNLTDQLVQRYSVEPPEILCIDFNAWAYTDCDKLWAGLVEKISRHLDKKLSLWQKITFTIHKSLFKSLVGFLPIAITVCCIGLLYFISRSIPKDFHLPAFLLSLIPSFASAAFFAKQQPLVDAIHKHLKNAEEKDKKGIMHRIQEDLRETIERHFSSPEATHQESAKQHIQKHNLKVVIFIDELDRCPLEKVVDILEGIKLFLSEEIFIVLLAVDTRVLAEAIHLRYTEATNINLAHEYMEKIIQIPIRIPQASASHLGKFVSKLMSVQKADIAGQESFGPEFKAESSGPEFRAEPSGPEFRAEPSGPEFRAEPSGPELSAKPSGPELAVTMAELFDTEVELAELSRFSETFLKGNPRRVKRLLNTYRFVKNLASLDHPVAQENWQRTMVNWLGATMAWPTFMEEAIRVAEHSSIGDDEISLEYRDELNQNLQHYRDKNGLPEFVLSQAEEMLRKNDFDEECWNLLREKLLYEYGSKVIELPPKEALPFLTLGKQTYLDFARLANNFIIEKPPLRRKKEKAN